MVDYEASTVRQFITFFLECEGLSSVINSRESHSFLLGITSVLNRIISVSTKKSDVKAFPLPLFNNPASESIKYWYSIGTEFCDFKIAVINC